MSAERAKILRQLLPFLSQNFINSETENRHEKLKKLVGWKKDSRRRHFVPEHSVLEFSAVITPRLAKRGSFSAIS